MRFDKFHFAEIYNLRLVWDWYIANHPLVIHAIEEEFGWKICSVSATKRREAVNALSALPIPQEIVNRLMWEPYLT